MALLLGIWIQGKIMDKSWVVGVSCLSARVKMEAGACDRQNIFGIFSLVGGVGFKMIDYQLLFLKVGW